MDRHGFKKQNPQAGPYRIIYRGKRGFTGSIGDALYFAFVQKNRRHSSPIAFPAEATTDKLKTLWLYGYLATHYYAKQISQYRKDVKKASRGQKYRRKTYPLFAGYISFHTDGVARSQSSKKSGGDVLSTLTEQERTRVYEVVRRSLFRQYGVDINDLNKEIKEEITEPYIELLSKAEFDVRIKNYAEAIFNERPLFVGGFSRFRRRIWFPDIDVGLRKDGRGEFSGNSKVVRDVLSIGKPLEFHDVKGKRIPVENWVVQQEDLGIILKDEKGNYLWNQGSIRLAVSRYLRKPQWISFIKKEWESGRRKPLSFTTAFTTNLRDLVGTPQNGSPEGMVISDSTFMLQMNRKHWSAKKDKEGRIIERGMKDEIDLLHKGFLKSILFGLYEHGRTETGEIAFSHGSITSSGIQFRVTLSGGSLTGAKTKNGFDMIYTLALVKD